jgi:hypothetical protein
MSTRAQQNKIILESSLSFFLASGKNRLAPVTRLAITMMRTRWQHFPEFLKRLEPSQPKFQSSQGAMKPVHRPLILLLSVFGLIRWSLREWVKNRSNYSTSPVRFRSPNAGLPVTQPKDRGTSIATV